jgi:hypothetical protein
MKFLHAAAFAVMLTLTSVPALCAQEPDQEKEKPKQQDEKEKKPPANKEKEKEKPQPKPDDRANPKTQPDQEKPGRETERQDERQRQEDRSATHEQGRNEANHAGGRRIPEQRFRASFGTEHHFRVARRDDRRFEYGGYAFEYVDAWPADWSYDDDVYIVLIGDDYYLVNIHHPEVRLRLIIVG